MAFRLSILAVVIASFGTFAQAQTVQMPDWAFKPSGAQIAEAYPRLAAALSMEGKSTIECKVDDKGLLFGCAALDEAPKGLGFGAAALSLSPQFKMRPMSVGGLVLSGGAVRIPIAFRLPSPAVAPAPRVDERRVGIAVKILEANGVADASRQDQQSQISALEVGDMPGVDPQARIDALGALRATMEGHSPVKEVVAPFFASRLTEAQLAEALAFSATPASGAIRDRRDQVGSALSRVRMHHFLTVIAGARASRCAENACDVEATMRGVVGNEDWLAIPTEEERRRRMPIIANRLQISGAASLVCDVITDGGLSKCRVLSESPTDMHFGNAALGLARFYKVSPEVIRTLNANRRLTLIVRFPAKPVNPPPMAIPERANLADAHDVLVGLAADKYLEAARDRMFPPLPSQFNDPVIGEIADHVGDLRKRSDAELPTTLDLAAAALTDVFSESEMRDLGAYMRSPTGKAVAKVQAEIIAQGWALPGLTAWQARQRAKVRALYCKTQDCTQPKWDEPLPTP